MRGNIKKRFPAPSACMWQRWEGARPCLFAPPRQRGSTLLESMIGILLVAIMGAGLTHVAAKALATQRYTTTQNLAVIQLRERLQTENAQPVVIAGTSLPVTAPAPANATLTIEVVGAAGTGWSTSASISRELTVDSTGLFGGAVSLTY